MSPDVSSLTTASFLIFFARWANCRVPSVSSLFLFAGETLATMQVFELPPSESRNKNVSFLCSNARQFGVAG